MTDWRASNRAELSSKKLERQNSLQGAVQSGGGRVCVSGASVQNPIANHSGDSKAMVCVELPTLELQQQHAYRESVVKRTT